MRGVRATGERRRATAVAALFLAALGACCTPRPVAPASLPTAAALAAEVRARQAEVRSLRGETKMDYLSREGRTKVTVNLAIARPGKLRFEAENPVSGHTEGTLVTDGAAFALLDVRHNRFLVGPALPCNVARMTRIAMPPAEVATILLGSAPVLPHTRAEVGWRPVDGGREVLTLHLDDGGTERIEIASRTRDVVAATLEDRAGHTVWRLAHEDFRTIGGVRLPAKTKFIEPREKADIIIRFKDVEANVDVPDAVFHLAPPPGMTPQPVGCEAASPP